MSSDPAVLFYTSDFLTGISFFTWEQRGQYITLLCEQHQCGHIPEHRMINVCSSYDNPVFSKFKKDDQGLFYNERMEFEIIKRANYCGSRLKASHARKFYQKETDHTIHHTINHKTHRSEDENENGIKDGVGVGEEKEGIQGGKEKTWRESFDLYQQDELASYAGLAVNTAWITEREKYHGNLDVRLSIEKAHIDYWSLEKGWKNKKASRSKEIDWTATYVNALTMKCNQVWLPRDSKNQVTGTESAEIAKQMKIAAEILAHPENSKPRSRGFH